MGFDFINKAIKKYTSGVDPAGANETFDNTTVVEYGAFHQSRSVPPKTALCLAPWVSINFTIDGFANVCCLNRKTAVDIKGKTINEIWQSEEFRKLRKSVAKGNLSYDCAVCKEQIDGGNFTGVKAISYDPFYPANPERPKVMEFCLDNTCNLACTMCNSVLSSTIRKKQNLPDFVPKYDDDFVQQLEEYIPFLESVVFSGGEPFLTPIYFKIWEKIIAIKPNLIISVVTNGTTLNSKIKNLLERGRFKINVSLDSVDKNTYESIRQNATFERVMENFAWFQDYGARKNLSVNIPVCVLTLNWQNIPDIIRFANEKDVSINFCLCRQAHFSCSCQ
jgi:MoaA/NifB/PqqE/SkfB family radical SAM enzyme